MYYDLLKIYVDWCCIIRNHKFLFNYKCELFINYYITFSFINIIYCIIKKFIFCFYFQVSVISNPDGFHTLVSNIQELLFNTLIRAVISYLMVFLYHGVMK